MYRQGSKVYASIHSRLHDSQAKVLEITCRLLATYPDLLKRAQKALGAKCASAESFATTDDICPVSDPNIFSEAQRFAQLQAVMQMQTAAPNLPWNTLEINRRGLQLLNFPDPDGVLPPGTDPVTADPVNENMQAILKNAPLRAAPEQDHLAHLREHLRFLTDPMGGANAVMPGGALAQILSHCAEHLTYLYVSHVARVGPDIAAQALGEGHKPNADTLSAAAAGLAAKQFNQMPEITALIPLFDQASKMVQSKQPPQPMDPTMATMQAAKDETERQKARDAADAQAKAQELAQTAQKQRDDAQAEMQKLGIEVQSILNDVREKMKQQDIENRQEWERIRQGWAAQETAAAKVGNERDDEIKNLLNTLMQRLEAPDPKEIVAPAMDAIDAVGDNVKKLTEVHQATQDAQKEHHDDLMGVIESKTPAAPPQGE